MTLREWLVPPDPDEDPRETLRRVRRAETAAGIALIVLGVALWSEGWLHWVLIGLGLVSLSPLSGAAAILRKAERNPDVLVADPARRRARARTVTLAQIPFQAVLGAIVGYAVEGWGLAIFMAVLTGGMAAAYAWWYRPRAVS
jgi:hypothetical protein